MYMYSKLTISKYFTGCISRPYVVPFVDVSNEHSSKTTTPQLNNIYGHLMYQLSHRNKIEKLLLPRTVGLERPRATIYWCIYHVPKTAGSSLRQSFTQALGEQAVFGIYRNTGASELGAGKPVWVPLRSSVLFGHFPTNIAHRAMFPNAKMVTWVREPLERAWSLLGHYLAVKEQSPQYRVIKENYIDKGVSKKAAIFERMLKENTFKASMNVYAHYFNQIPLDKFDFVGSVSKNTEDLKRLQRFIGKPLQEAQENVRNSASTFPSSLRYLEKELASEYELVDRFL